MNREILRDRTRSTHTGERWFHIVVDVLLGASAAKQCGRGKVCNFLPVARSSTVKEILTGHQETLEEQRIVKALRGVSIALTQHRIRRTMRDWPFENFWTDPNEPQHSKLLGFFIDGRQGHKCDEFLRNHFLAVLKGAIKPLSLKGRTLPAFDAGGCEVDVESEHIDLCIERTCGDEKFAIIIENKVHFANDQPNQLQGYVEKAHRRGFGYSQIWVFYAPLTAEKNPDPNDLAEIERLGVCCNKITFETEILAWLNKVLASDQADRPSEMDGGMADNLSHYRDLIHHLIERRKEFHMKTQILQQLSQADNSGAMPKFSDLKAMTESVNALQECLEQVYRAKLMREIHRLLNVEGKKASLCLEDEPEDEILVNSDFDERFAKNVGVYLSVGAGVRVCFSGGGEGTWVGYMKQGSSEERKQVEAHVLREAKEELQEVRTTDPKWFGWDYKAIDYTDDFLATLPREIANKLLKMSVKLKARLKAVR